MSIDINATPIHDAVVARLGPLCDPVDTDYVLLVSQAVLALMEGSP